MTSDDADWAMRDLWRHHEIWLANLERIFGKCAIPTPDRNRNGEKPQALSAKHESGLPEGSS